MITTTKELSLLPAPVKKFAHDLLIDCPDEKCNKFHIRRSEEERQKYYKYCEDHDKEYRPIIEAWMNDTSYSR